MQTSSIRFIFVTALLAGTVYLAVSQGARVVTRPKSVNPAVIAPAAPAPTAPPSGPQPVVIKDRPEYQGGDLEGRKWEYCTVTAPIEAAGDYLYMKPLSDQASAIERGIYAARANRFKPKEEAFLGEMNKLGQAGWEPYGSFVFTPTAFQQPQAEVGPHVAVMMKRRIK